MKSTKNRYGLGLDISKSHFHACLVVIDPNTRKIKVVASRKFEQNLGGFNALYAWLKAKIKDIELLDQVVMEATGCYHEKVLYYLHDRRLPVCLVTGKHAKRYRQSLGYESKNDKLDGRVLAQLALERQHRRWEPVSPMIIQIRSTMRHRKALIDMRVAFSNRLHALEYAHHQEWVIIAETKQLIEMLDSKIIQAEKYAKDLAQADPVFWKKIKELYESFPSLGFVSLMTVIAETNGFADFENSRQVVSYAGYDVVENQSGKFTGKTRISKQGNAILRSVLYMPTLTLIRLETQPFKNLYQRVLQRNPKVKKKAQTAVQRKLLTYIYTLWKKNETFDPDYHKQQQNQLHDKQPQKRSSPGLTPELHGIVTHKAITS